MPLPLDGAGFRQGESGSGRVGFFLDVRQVIEGQLWRKF